VEDVRASGDGTHGDGGLSPGEVKVNEPKCEKHEGEKGGGAGACSPARHIARRDDVFMSSGSVLGSSCDGMSTESDLAAMRLAKTPLSPRGSSCSCSGNDVMPIKLLHIGGEGFGGYGRGPTAFNGLFGRPGEVGGRASQAELTECALRLCVCIEREGTTCAWSSKRVLVMEMV
jgi:hypothetical protein